MDPSPELTPKTDTQNPLHQQALATTPYGSFEFTIPSPAEKNESPSTNSADSREASQASFEPENQTGISFFIGSLALKAPAFKAARKTREVVRKTYNTTAIGTLTVRKFINDQGIDQTKRDMRNSRKSMEVRKELASSVLEARSITHGFEPVGIREKHHSIRNTRRVLKAKDGQFSHLYRQRRVWGEDIGTHEYVDRIKSSHMSQRDKRAALKAHDKYKVSQKHNSKLYEKVDQSIEGRDLGSRYIHASLKSRQKAAKKLWSKSKKLEKAIARRKSLTVTKAY